MRSFRIRRLGVLILVVIATLSLAAIWRMQQVAAVQDAVDRDWEITFNVDEVPRAMPMRLDAAASAFIERALGREREPLFFSEKPNRSTVWQERVRSTFRGRITRIEIYYPGRLRGDLGEALAGFSGLKQLLISEPEFSKTDWAYVFMGLKKLRNLEELEIGQENLYDSTMEPLAGQQSLRKVSITLGRLGTECVETFGKLPNLRELTIYPEAFDDGHGSDEGPLPENQKLIREALPNVKVTFGAE